MLIYPQLQSGALSQFPVRKRRTPRTVVNRLADGSAIKYPDPDGAVTEWSLEYSDLTDDEVAAIEEFFAAAEGTLNGFTFLDPTANLLAWSGNLEDEVWQRGPFVSLTAAIPDPRGRTGAWRVTNTGLGPQAITQTLPAPGAYLYCFSAYVRSSSTNTVTMLVGETPAERRIGSEWSRIVCMATGNAGAESTVFGVELEAGATVDLYGMQVEPQPGASMYRPSTAGGVHENARLRDDVLTVTTTGVNRHSCTVNIIHANHL